jgi:signal transduction histidine kinase
MRTVLRRTIQVTVPLAALLISVAELSGPHSAPGRDYVVSGSAFAIAGLIAWSLRPANRVGLLMMAVGGALLLPVVLTAVLAGSSITQVQVVTSWLGALWEVLLIHLLVAFPEGRLGSTTSRTLVGSLYFFFVVSLFAEPFLFAGAVYPFFLFLAVVLILRRWWLGGQARRRSLTPVLWSLAPIALAIDPSAFFRFWTDFGLPSSGVGFLLSDTAPLFLIALPAGFLIGLLRSGLDMTSVGSLVVRLSGGLLPGQLQPALAEALHDPSLEIVYWVPSLDSFADLEGRHVELPGPDDVRAASVIAGDKEPIAALLYDASLLLEPLLVETAAAAVRMALENARLQVQLRAQLEEVRQSRTRLVRAAQSERQRVERDLHDGAQQQLVTLLLSLQLTKAEAARHADAETATLIDANIASLKQALAELRELARGIYPSILTEAGLVPAVRSLAERSPIPVEVKASAGDDRLPPQIEATLYFVAAEALTNAVKHSHAQHICVAMQRVPGSVSMDVSDDGTGGADISAGTGLRGLSDRVSAVGGRLLVQNDAGRGTKIHSEIPCA